MSKQMRLILVALTLAALVAPANTTFAATPEREARAAPARKVYPPLEVDFSIYGWHKSDTPRDLIGTMTVYPRGGDGHYTYEFIGLRYTNTFDFRWRACTTLVNSLRVWSGDGQRIDVPVWRDDLPCPRHWPDEDDE
jgi:hypothetical protein